MPLDLGWHQIALRLALAFLAGAVIGTNRTERGRPAGLRTTILVSLAACVAMLQANLLMGAAGKPPSSFVVLDLMRLPLGILTGMGFIGAGAILRKGKRVVGVTTAATLWFVTVIGLCFGGGQLGLGVAATLLAIFTLWFLHWVERRMTRDRHGTLAVTALTANLPEEEIRAMLASEQCKILSSAGTYAEHATVREVRFRIVWSTQEKDIRTPLFVERLAQNPNVLKLEWTF